MSESSLIYLISIWAPSTSNLNLSPSLSIHVIMDWFNDSNPPVQHTQSYTLGQLPDTSEQGLSTFDFTLYLQTQYDPPNDSTTSTFNQAGPLNAGFNNSPYDTDLNSCSQSSLSLYDHDPVDFQSAWVGIFDHMGQGLWETPGYRTTQAAGGYLESLPGYTTDTFSNFIIHQPNWFQCWQSSLWATTTPYQLLQTTVCTIHHMSQADHQRVSQVIWLM